MKAILDWFNSTAFETFGAPTTWAELFGFVTGLLSVGLVAINRISNFFWGMLNAFFFFVLFFNAKLFADGILQVMFFVLCAYGWWAWLKAGPNRTALHVERANKKVWALSLALFAVVYAVEIPVLKHVGDTYVYFDAFILAASLVAQLQMALKKIDNWWIWIAVDIVSIPLYFVKGLNLTGIVYIVFMALCFVGLREWYLIYKGKKVDEVVASQSAPARVPEGFGEILGAYGTIDLSKSRSLG
jgi:nicotinamide mononucleotide transporter